jgi:hypothetical protein
MSEVHERDGRPMTGSPVGSRRGGQEPRPRRAGADDAARTLQPLAVDGVSVEELFRLGVRSGALRDLLRRVVEFAVEAVGAESASLVVGAPGSPDLLVFSLPPPEAGDRAQYGSLDGPTFQAHQQRRPVVTGDLFGDGRWPALSAGTDAEPLSCVALPVTIDDETVAVLTLYAGRADAFAEETVRALRPHVATAERLIADDRLVSELTLARDQFKEALTSRAVIDQAKGVLMYQQGCDADEAFGLLKHMSNSRNRRLRDVAADIVRDAADGRPPGNDPGGQGRGKVV